MAEIHGLDIVRNGLVLHLDAGNPQSFDGNSTTWYDLSGNGNHATINTTYVTYDNTGGGVLQFSGNGSVSQGGLIPNTAQYLSSANTVEFSWFAPNQSSGQILSNPYYSYGESGSVYDKNGGNGISLGISYNVWNHLTVTFDGMSTQVAYRNTTYVHSRSIMNWSGLTGSLTLGARSWSPYTQNFKLGLLKIYNRVLTQSEITQNFNATRSRYGI